MPGTAHDKIKVLPAESGVVSSIVHWHYSANARSFFGQDSLSPSFFPSPAAAPDKRRRAAFICRDRRLIWLLPLTRLIMGKPIR